MSIANLADQENLVTGLEIYAHTIGAQEIKNGVSGNEYIFPPNKAAAVGDIIRAYPIRSQLNFVTNAIGQITLGGQINANPRYMVVGGTPGTAVNNVQDYNSEFVVPYTCKLAAITWGSQSMDATTSWVLQRGATLTPILINANPFIPASIELAAGQVNTISWRGTGTNPGNTSFVLWLERVG